jgi:methionyl-tRNA formyltransferase
MRILFLGSADSAILRHLREVESEVTTRGPNDVLEDAALIRRADRIVSHGYRQILPAATLAIAPHRFINCHISLLPWNRGADPNLWSILEGTPKGVSIHVVDPGVDTGDLIAQIPVALEDRDTLATSYQRLQGALADLFRATWPTLATGRASPQPQPEGGNMHRTRDLLTVAHLLTSGWDTPISSLAGRLPPHTGAAHG